jgi:hypothetical protein
MDVLESWKPPPTLVSDNALENVPPVADTVTWPMTVLGAQL